MRGITFLFPCRLERLCLEESLANACHSDDRREEESHSQAYVMLSDSEASPAKRFCMRSLTCVRDDIAKRCNLHGVMSF